MRILILSFVLLFTISWNTPLAAQCPQCRMSAENNLKDGGKAATGLNQGILYLLTIPYILMGTLGYLWWRSRMQVAQAEEEEELLELLEKNQISLGGQHDEL